MRLNVLNLIFILFLPIWVYCQHASVRIQVIDRGQGDGMLIRTPNEKWVVIDGVADTLQAHAMQHVWDVDTVDLAIISHRHNDHFKGMDAILRRIPVKQIVFDMRDRSRSVDDTIRAIIGRKNIPVLAIQSDTLIIDGVSFVIFDAPPTAISSSKENNNCVIVKLIYGQFSMLFPGDAETRQRNWLISSYGAGLDSDVLKASHHGANNGTNDNWLQTVTPSHVIISAGVNASYGHPQANAVNAYLAATDNKVYCTNRHGTIRIYGFDDGRIRIYRQRQNTKDCTFDGTHY
jgi:competence protein ComEC